MLSLRKLNLDNLITGVATIVTLISTIVYVTWFAASIDKRVSLLEQHDADSAQIVTMHDQEFQSFQSTVNAKLASIDEEMNKILFLLTGKKNAD